MQIAISLVAFTAWLSAANHCAFGEAVSESAGPDVSAHSDCPGHKAPGKTGGADGDLACCKSFPSASLTPAKNFVSYNTDSSTIHFAFLAAIVSPAHSQLELRPLELDTGPPFARSLVEFVLQRSLQAHAPPSLA